MEKPYSHILNASAEKSTIRLSGEINQYTAERFIQEFDYLVNEVGAKLITLKINSQGGAVLAGYDIVSTILNSEVEVHAMISGLAASIASVIALACDRVKMTDYSLLMVHEVFNASNPNPDAKEQEVLSKFNSSLRKIYSKRGIAENQMEEWMNEETFFSAEDCLANGLADEIIATSTKSLETENKTIEELFNLFNSLDSETKVTLHKPQQMQEVLNFLGLEEGSEQEILNALQVLKQDTADLKIKNEGLVTNIANKDAEIEQLQNKVSEFEAAAEAAQKKAAEDLVNSAVEARKIPATAKEHWLKLANENFETTKAVLASITTSVKLSNLTQDAISEEKPKAFVVSDFIKAQTAQK
jgi:ATP-dependent Clp protease protease subunit